MNKQLKINAHARVDEKHIPPTVLTIFGATGDLSSDYLLPALLHMEEHHLLPDSFKLVCAGRRDFTTKTYLDFIIKKSSTLSAVPQKVKQTFLKRLLYYQGDFDRPESFAALAEILSDQESKQKHVECSRHWMRCRKTNGRNENGSNRGHPSGKVTLQSSSIQELLECRRKNSGSNHLPALSWIMSLRKESKDQIQQSGEGQAACDACYNLDPCADGSGDDGRCRCK
jgi:hypothetical protein